ncbi:MAG: DUF3786 domain-containing protein [Planctomycetales bacterium]|nr:DUF3786 domain-containing protein [Planctomycetales bacterium]
MPTGACGIYWDALEAKDINTLCNLTLFSPFSPRQLLFHFLREDVLVDSEARCLRRWQNDGWEPTDDPLLEMVTVLYLANVTQLYPIGKDIVGVNDLKEGHFFQGPHALKIEPLLRRYGTDVMGFKQAAEYLEGEPRIMADAAYRLLPFPRIPLYYLLWGGDQEFKPRISILFDRSIETLLAADAIWALVNRVSTALLEGPGIDT